MDNWGKIVRIPAVVVATLVVLVGTIVAAGPASADPLPPPQRVAELNAPYERCGIASCTLYLDRSTAKYFADRLDAAGLGNARVGDVAGELLCEVFKGRIGFACGLVGALVGSSFLEAVQDAENIDGCVTFKHLRNTDILATYAIGATNSKYCRD
jgi:hypothetical protein